MFGLRIAVGLALVCIGFAVLNLGLSLVSSQSDLAVWMGVIILIVFAVAAAYLGRWIFSRVKISSNRSGMMLLMAAIAGASFFATGCAKTIPPGHVGIVVNQYGSQKGVADFPLKTGRVWYNPVERNRVRLPRVRAEGRVDQDARRRPAAERRGFFQLKRRHGLHG